MLEILVVMAVIAVGILTAMARHGRRRWTADMQSVPWTETNSLGTLADVTVVASTTLPTSDNEYRVLSVSTMWGLRGHTAGEGPILVGYAHGDYSVTEIKEALEAEAVMTRGNKIAAEQANRLVRRVGFFSGDTTEEVLNDGKPIRTRLNWVIPDGLTLQQWAYNQSGGGLTTGTVVMTNGKATIKWL